MKFRFPYDTDANEVEMLAQIKELAATCVRSGHVSVDWPDYLGIYLELKYTVSQQDRIWFAEILYDVATSGDDIAISEPYLFLITVLLKFQILTKRVKNQTRFRFNNRLAANL